MKGGWQIKPLQELCKDFRQDIVDGPFGSDLQRKDYLTEGVPVLKIQNVKPFAIELKKMDYVSPTKFQELKRHTYRRGDIVMTKLGNPLGASAIVENLDDGVIVADLVRIRAQLIDTKFLCYYLNSPRTNDYLNSMQKGTTRPRMRLSVVRELPISVPSPEVQQLIVRLLDEAFDGIATAKANAEKNLVNVRVLFESILKGMYERVGKGWVEKKLGDIASEMQTGPFGSMLHKSDYVADGIPVVNPQNIVNGKIIPLQKMMVNLKTQERLSRFILRENDILLARRGEMGRCALVEKEQVGWLCGSGSFVIRVKKEVNANYLVSYLSSAKVKRILQKGSVGATMDNLNQGILTQIPVPFPPLAEQNSIVAKLDTLRDETQRLETIYQRKLAALDELKKSLLHQAFNGEL